MEERSALTVAVETVWGVSLFGKFADDSDESAIFVL